MLRPLRPFSLISICTLINIFFLYIIIRFTRVAKGRKSNCDLVTLLTTKLGVIGLNLPLMRTAKGLTRLHHRATMGRLT